VTPELAASLDRSIGGLRALELGDAFEPAAARVLVDAGLHRLVVPAEAGGLAARLEDACEVLLAIGAVDGSTALGFAMQVHVVGALVDAAGTPVGLRNRFFRSIVDDGALVNNAATEEGGGSPARGAIPGTTAAVGPDGSWRLTGEKTWTTWLPNLTHAFVTARLEAPATAGDKREGRAPDGPEIGVFLVDLATAGVDRRPGFEALGMRGSASGRLVLDGVEVPADALLVRRGATEPDPRGPAPGAWFGMAIAATYLGVGEGARDEVARWALDRRPGDGSTAVAEIPTVQLRLGRLDAELRSARIVVLDVARRWDEATAGGTAADLAAVAREVPLAKWIATRAAVAATEEALRIAGGPGFLAGRLERAFRDARAGLINPPLEDVALTGFGRAVLETVGASE
jgi:alkylation response protein AidB-like acyl-CoA dehydrogenase